MYKINIYDKNVFLKSEIFVNQDHAISWSNEQKEKTGYDYEIVDLSLDVEWVREDIRKKRAKEYPKINDLVEAIVEHIKENRPEKLNQLQAERIAIKAKYPLP